MMIDLHLFAYLAVAVAVVGSFLWVRSWRSAKSKKLSGVGDQGQYR